MLSKSIKENWYRYSVYALQGNHDASSLWDTLDIIRASKDLA